MSKNKRYISPSKGLCLIFSGLILISLVNSCREEPTPAEIQYLDTLQRTLDGNDKALSISPQELVRRKDLIKTRWLPKTRDTFPDIAEKMRDDLHAMISAYDLYLNNHLLLISSNKLLQTDVSELRQTSLKGELSRDEFRVKYKELKDRSVKVEKEIELIARPVYDLEAMWLRFHKILGD